MRFLTVFFFLFSFISFGQKLLNYPTPFEKGNGNQSTTYDECIAYYKELDANFESIQLFEKGKTDSGKPLHIVVFSENKNFKS